jgi:hypothetical protein
MEVHWGEDNRAYGFDSAPDDPDEDDKDSQKAPETPLDEPRPPRVQDPPLPSGQKGPYVVRARVGNYGRAER